MKGELVFVLAVLAIGVAVVEAADRRREPYTEGRVEQILPLAETMGPQPKPKPRRQWKRGETGRGYA